MLRQHERAIFVQIGELVQQSLPSKVECAPLTKNRESHGDQAGGSDLKVSVSGAPSTYSLISLVKHGGAGTWLDQKQRKNTRSNHRYGKQRTLHRQDPKRQYRHVVVVELQ